MMLKIIKFFIIIIFLLVPSVHSFAWGRAGQNIIIQIAWNRLDTQIQYKFRNLTGSTSLGNLMTWMDGATISEQYSFMKYWHHINFPKGQSFAAKTEENIITELTRYISIYCMGRNLQIIKKNNIC